MPYALSAAVPALPSHSLLLFLVQVALLLATAVVLGRIAQRVGLPSLAGELCAGLLFGPSLLGALAPGALDQLFPQRAEQFHLLDGVGQLGVLLLVGLAGMEIERAVFRRHRWAIVTVSTSGLLVPGLLGAGAGLLLPAALVGRDTDRMVFSLFLAVAMAVTAIPVIAKILMDLRLVHRTLSKVILAAAMIDDAIAWIALSVVSALAASTFSGTRVALAVASVGLVVGVAMVPGRLLVTSALRWAARQEPDMTGAVVTALLLVAGAATQALGLEAVFGAFLCGVVVSSSPAFDRLRVDNLRSVVLTVLAPLFFATAGLRMDLTSLADTTVLGAAVALLGLAVVGKFLGAYVGARIGGFGHWEGLTIGAGMNARGVVAVIVANVGMQLGVLTTASYTVIVLVAIATSAMTGPLLRFTMGRVELMPEERHHPPGRASLPSGDRGGNT